MDFYPPPAPVSETSTYQKLLVPLRSNKQQTPDKDVVMLSPPHSSKGGTQPPSNRPVFSNDDFIPFSLDDDTRSNKKRRERGEEEVTPNPTVNPYQVRPVWVDPSVDVTTLKLGDELNYFYNWISLTEEENNLREYAIQLIRDIVKSIWPAARVEVFGSHYTKISLPSSDVDLMVYNVAGDDPLARICSEINMKYASEFVLIKLIPQAKMPVLKLTTKLGEVKLDMCIAVKDEPPNSVKIAEYLANMPVLRPLVVTLKQFLQQYLLNDTYTGGAGSYLLTLMSISLLQFRKNPFSSAFLGVGGNSVSHFGKSQDLGIILLEFFELYGRIFNYHKHGISVRGTGKYFLKQERGWLLPHAPHLLSIEDPSDPENDVGRGSFNMMQVRLAFFQAFVRLTHPDTERTLPNYRVSSLLTRVIDMDPIYLSRRQRAKMIGATLKSPPTSDDKSDSEKPATSTNSTTPYESTNKSEKFERSEKSDDEVPYTPSPAVASIMVGDKNLADLEALTFSPNAVYPTPTDIDEKEVEVIDLNSDSEYDSSTSPSLSPLPVNPSLPMSIPTLPSSPPRPILGSHSSSSSSSSATSSSPPSGLSTSPNASKAYSNGISNVIVNNHSRSPNAHAHSHFNSNFTSNYNTNFVPKQKNRKHTNTHINNNFTNTSTSTNPHSNTHHSTSTHTNTHSTHSTSTHSTHPPFTHHTNTHPQTTHTKTSSSNTNTNTHTKPDNKKQRFSRRKGTHLNSSNKSTPSTSTSSSSSSSSSSSTPTTTHATNTSAGNAGNASNTTNTTNAGNNTGRNNSAIFSPGKRRKF